MARAHVRPGCVSYLEAGRLTGLTQVRLQSLVISGQLEARVVPGEPVQLLRASVERLARELGRETATAAG